MTGSTVRPIVPAKLSAIAGAAPSFSGTWARTQSATDIPEDDRAGALEEDLRPVEEAQAESAEGRHAIGRHLEDERRPFALQDRGLQDARRDDRRDEAEDVEAEQRGGARARGRARRAGVSGRNAAMMSV